MQHYQVILNEERLKSFINWLPDLEIGERYYVCLFARRKYAPAGFNLSSDKGQLKRIVATKEYLFDKIMQMECPLGAYRDKGLVIPQEALALYINPNPRSTLQATKYALCKFADVLTKPDNGFNPYSEVLGCLQKASARTVFVDFDFDNVAPEDVKQALEGRINFDALQFVKTKNGFHLLVETKKVEHCFVKSWHQSIAKLPGCDVRGDCLLPVPGCTQGGFEPYLMEK